MFANCTSTHVEIVIFTVWVLICIYSTDIKCESHFDVKPCTIPLVESSTPF